MFKKLMLISSIFWISSLRADIVEINQIDELRPYEKENALYLFDVDDTLIGNPFTLGSGPWRNWVKSKLPVLNTNFVLFDALTLYIAKQAPYIAVEPSTVNLINQLQDKGHAVFAFTARGRSQWYTTHVEGIDAFTHEQLRAVGIDFSRTQIPQELQQLDDTYFNEGIIFASHIIKGDLLKDLLKGSPYKPSLIIFVDDRLDQVHSVEAAASDAGIPFMGFWYRRSELDHKNFSPVITNVQLEYLLLKGEIISDDEALELAAEISTDDHQSYFEEIFRKIDVSQIAPVLSNSGLYRTQ